MLDKHLCLSTSGFQLLSNSHLDSGKATYNISYFHNVCLKKQLLFKKGLEHMVECSFFGKRTEIVLCAADYWGIQVHLSPFCEHWVRIIFTYIFHFILQVILLNLVFFVSFEVMLIFSAEVLSEKIKAVIHPNTVDEIRVCTRALVKDLPFHLQDEKTKKQPLLFSSPQSIFWIILPTNPNYFA